MATTSQVQNEDGWTVRRSLTASDDASYVGFHDAVPMLVGRSDHTVTLFDYNYDVYGPRIYIVGGCTGDQVCSFNQPCSNSGPDAGKSICDICACTSITASAEYFNPETDKFTSLKHAPTMRYRGQAAGLGTKLYVFGGRDLNDTIIQTVDVLDTLTSAWSTYTAGASGTLASALPPAVSDGGAFAYGTKVYIVGGYDQNYNQNGALYSIDVTTTPAWTVDLTLPAMPTGRGDISVQLFGGDYYAIGGWNNAFSEALPTVESYNIDSASWTLRPAMLWGRGDLV